MKRAAAPLLLVLLVLAGCGGSAESQAIDTCHDAVLDELKSPSSAEWPSTSEHVSFSTDRDHWSVSGWVDADNAYGSSQRLSWSCDASREDGGDWTVYSLTGPS